MAKEAKRTFKAEGYMANKRVAVHGAAFRDSKGFVSGVLNIDGLRPQPLRWPFFFNVGKVKLSDVLAIGENVLRSLGFSGIVKMEQSGEEKTVDATPATGPFKWPGAARVDHKTGNNKSAGGYRWGAWRVVQGRPGGGLWLDPKYGNVDVVAIDRNGYVNIILAPEEFDRPEYLYVPIHFKVAPVGVPDEEWCEIMDVAVRAMVHPPRDEDGDIIGHKPRPPKAELRQQRGRAKMPGITEKKKPAEVDAKSVIRKYIKGL